MRLYRQILPVSTVSLHLTASGFGSSSGSQQLLSRRWARLTQTQIPSDNPLPYLGCIRSTDCCHSAGVHEATISNLADVSRIMSHCLLQRDAAGEDALVIGEDCVKCYQVRLPHGIFRHKHHVTGETNMMLGVDLLCAARSLKGRRCHGLSTSTDIASDGHSAV